VGEVNTRQRIILIALSVLVAVVAIVLLLPERADDPGVPAGQTGGEAPPGEQREPTGTETEPAPPAPRRIAVVGGEVKGGVQEIKVTAGEVVRLVVSSDSPDDIHLHGYDIEREAGPGEPARFRFEADIEGAFEIESHVAEDAGLEPLIANLVVEPG